MKKIRPPLHNIYTWMRQRCYNPNHIHYKSYWWKWISIIWKLNWTYKEFEEAIYNSIGKRPSPKHTIDRINNDWNYEIWNIRWSDWNEQFNNRSDNVVANGKTLSQWSKYFWYKTRSFWRMYHKYWFEEAVKRIENRKPIFRYNWMTISEMGKYFWITWDAIRMCLKSSWMTIEEVYNHYNNKYK